MPQIMGVPAVLALVLVATGARADRPVTDAERVKLDEAVRAQSCSGGKMEFDDDDRQFEVDDAVCTDGRKYDLKFDAEFKLLRKNLD
jgi:peptidase YpeB-like protein